MPKQTKSNAPRISPETWERHKHRIKTLFIDDDETLSNVMEIMKSDGLHARLVVSEMTLA
jgi:CBS domain-containing protein